MSQQKKNVEKSRIAIRVKPNSQRSHLLGFNRHRQVLEVALNAPARDGEANAELIELLQEYLKISKSKIIIVTGLKSRNKVVEVECSPEELANVFSL